MCRRRSAHPPRTPTHHGGGGAASAAAAATDSESSLAEPSGGSALSGTAEQLMEQLVNVESWLHDLDRPFPWSEIEWNRCALQLSTQTGLDEIHSLFSFMSIGQVWITSAGQLQGVVTDVALIAACLHGEEAR